MYFRLAAVWSLAALSALAQSPKPNFTGAWTRELLGAAISEIDHIKHQEPLIDVQEQLGRRADVIYGETCRTDGTTWERRFGDTRIECTGHWEGTRLILDKKWINSQGERTTHVELYLSDDGNTMTKRVAQRSASGETSAKTFQYRRVTN